jgi:hypothetical protein
LLVDFDRVVSEPPFSTAIFVLQRTNLPRNANISFLKTDAEKGTPGVLGLCGDSYQRRRGEGA